MKCPFCDRNMQEGVVQSGRKVYFTEKPHKFFFNAEADEVTLTTHNWTAPTVKAWNCGNCLKVIVDYEETWCKENR